MGTIIDLTGQKFGRFTIIKIADGKQSTPGAFWECLCQCGNIVIILGKRLRSGATKSCGCLQREVSSKVHKGRIPTNRKKLGESCSKKLFSDYKRNAKIKNREFNLSFTFFLKKTQENCFYCGIKPSSKRKAERYYGEFTYNGLDRLNNFMGYTEENVVTCCKTCNYAKHDLSREKWKEYITRLVKYNSAQCGE